MWLFVGHKNLHFDNELNAHVMSKNYEESGYTFDLDLLSILYQLCVLYPKKSGIVGESNHIRPI